MRTTLATAFDIDGVVAHTEKLMVEIANSEFGLNLDLERWTHYSMEDSFGLPTILVREIITAALTKENAHRIPVDEEGIAVLEDLCKIFPGASILFITSRRSRENAKYFLDNFVVKDRFLYELRTKTTGTTAENKIMHMIEGYCNALVDDCPETCRIVKNSNNCYELPSARMISILLARPWNRYISKDDYTVRANWKEVKNLAIVIEELLLGC